MNIPPALEEEASASLCPQDFLAFVKIRRLEVEAFRSWRQVKIRHGKLFCRDSERGANRSQRGCQEEKHRQAKKRHFTPPTSAVLEIWTKSREILLRRGAATSTRGFGCFGRMISLVASTVSEHLHVSHLHHLLSSNHTLYLSKPCQSSRG